MAEPTPLYKHVTFDLPFVVFVHDGMRDRDLEKWIEASSSGEQPAYTRYAPCANAPSAMILGGGGPVYLPPPGEVARLYDVALGNIRVGMRFLRRVNPHRSVIMKGEVPGDRAGRASFSTVQVLFDLRYIREELHHDMPVFVELSVTAVNHFLSHYRVLADRPYIYQITPSVIQEFRLLTVRSDRSNFPQWHGTGSGPMLGFAGGLPDGIDDKLRAAVSRTSSPPIDEVLDANIRDHLDLREWRLAVVECAVLFESWLNGSLRNRLRTNGESEAMIEARFRKPNGNPLSVTSIAVRLVSAILGFDFQATTEFADWARHVRDVRNDIVHGTRFEITPDEAETAYAAVNAAKRLLESK